MSVEAERLPDGPLRVLLADDHEPFRRAMRGVIDAQDDMQIVAEAADGAEAVRVSRSLRPDGLDVVLMDIDMPRLDGIKATQQITAADPDLPVVMLTVSMLERDLLAAVEAGAVGFLSKSIAPDALVRALRDFHRDGALPMSRTMAARVVGHLRAAAHREQPACGAADESSAPKLTAREREVLELMSRGARDREIGDRLGLSQFTIKKHVKSLLHKLGARNRVEAVARKQGGLL